MGIVHVKIPDALRDHFKAICALKGTSMQEEILHLIEREVDKGKLRK